MSHNKEKLQFLTARLKAVNKISYLLDTKEATEWDFTSICKIFVSTIGYMSCWIALMNDSGEIEDFWKYEEANVFSYEDEFTYDFIYEYVKEVLVQSSDYVINKDPLLYYIDKTNDEVVARMNSVSIKLSHNNIIYGVLSVTLNGQYDIVKEEILIISELVKTISFFLYDRDSMNKIRNLVLTVFETTGNPTTLIEEDTTISYANKEFEKLSGFARKEIENRMRWTDFVADPDDLRMMLEFHRLRRIDSSKAPHNYFFKFKDRDGAIKDIHMNIDIVPRTKVSIASYRNITEKKKLESEILKVGEQERLRIGTELHDGLGPHLVGVQFLIKLIKQKVKNNILPELSAIEEVQALVSQAIDNTRILTKGLKPVDIQSDGLIYALNDLTEKTAGIYGIQCLLDFDVRFSIKNNIVATHLYYIVQESINNAIKHAQAENIYVNLQLDGNDYLIVEIIDDGIGFGREVNKDKGIGISIMEHRASIIDSSILIENNDPSGTRVRCRLRR